MNKELENFVLELIDEIDVLGAELIYERSSDTTGSQEKHKRKIEDYKEKLEELK